MRFLISVLMLILGATAVAFAAPDSLTAGGNGIAGNAFIGFVQSIIPGAGPDMALTIWSAIVLIIVRVAQFTFSKMPTVQRNIVQRIFWMIVPLFLGKQVKEENYQPDDVVEEITLKEDLKKRYPILRTKIVERI